VYKDGDAAATHSGSEHMGAYRQHFRDVFDAQAVKIVQLDQIAAIER
jgi:quinol monooxygenase YgiN